MSDDASTTDAALVALRQRSSELHQDISHLSARLAEVNELIALLETPQRIRKPRTPRNIVRDAPPAAEAVGNLLETEPTA